MKPVLPSSEAAWLLDAPLAPLFMVACRVYVFVRWWDLACINQLINRWSLLLAVVHSFVRSMILIASEYEQSLNQAFLIRYPIC